VIIVETGKRMIMDRSTSAHESKIVICSLILKVTGYDQKDLPPKQIKGGGHRYISHTNTHHREVYWQISLHAMINTFIEEGSKVQVLINYACITIILGAIQN
jgi:hypothetical protein